MIYIYIYDNEWFSYNSHAILTKSQQTFLESSEMFVNIYFYYILYFYNGCNME